MRALEQRGSHRAGGARIHSDGHPSIDYISRNGKARVLRDMLAQEGHALRAAGCAGPTLDGDEIAYTRELLKSFMDADDMRPCIECLFSDEAGRTLGLTPRGLSFWAGLALAYHDAVSPDQVEAVF